MAYIPNPNQSVSGTVGASIIGIATQRLDAQVQGSTLGLVTHAVIHGLTAAGGGNYVDVKVDPSGALVTALGSVVSFQGTSPWIVAPNNSSMISIPSGSVAAVIIGGSIATSSPANQSVSGTIQADIRGSVATVIIGGSIAASFTPPANQSVSGAVSVSNLPANQSVSGTVGTTQTGTWISSMVNTVPSSVIVGTSIFGQLPAGTAMLGSITAYQGAVPWATVNVGSIITLNIGSVITVWKDSSVLAGQTGVNRASVSGVGGLSVTSSVYAVLSSITTISILNANTNRIGATIYNRAGTDVFVKLGTAATTSIYTVKMADGSYYELPFGWGGVVAGISASNAGVLTVTEIT